MYETADSFIHSFILIAVIYCLSAVSSQKINTKGDVMMEFTLEIMARVLVESSRVESNRVTIKIKIEGKILVSIFPFPPIIRRVCLLALLENQHPSEFVKQEPFA